MIFRIVVVCLALAAAYAGYELWAVRNFYKTLQDPDPAFTVVNDGNQASITIVEFLNYNCIECRKAHLVLLDYAESNKDVRLVIRPVPFANSKDSTERALAAGFQGKFRELDRAMTEYGGDYTEKFYREAAALYEIDYDRMVKDSAGKKVFDMAAENVKAAGMAEIKSNPTMMIGKSLYHPQGELTLPDLIRMVQQEKSRL